MISVGGIHKRFAAADRGGAWLRALAGRSPATGIEVLKEVSLTVARGESVAILGENGAGKSTLLKIVAGLLSPDAGEVHIEGSVGAMLELGVGFDEHLSGRDNALQACQLAGMTQAQAQASLAQVESFSGLGDALAEPVSHYSSGMVVRLGFAVMTATEPDVLISDEVLAVGDESFQKKCITWVESYLAQGGTLLLVSHSLYHVQRLCSRAIWLHEGQVKASGDVFDVSQDYLAFHEQKLGESLQAFTGDQVRLERFSLTVPASDCWTDAELIVETQLEGGFDNHRLRWQLGRLDGAVIGSGSLPCRNYLRWEIRLPGTWLPGNLRLDAWPVDAEGQRCGRTQRRMVRVPGRAREFGTLRLPYRWLEHD
ncbi:MAG: ATP-binding cassette domain-containing protein [Pseudomonadota bacterium]